VIDRAIRQPRGTQLIVLTAGAVVAELAIAVVGRSLGPDQLLGLHGVLAASFAIATGLVAGPVAGAIVGGIGAAAFVVLIGYESPPDPYLYGIPVVILWAALAAAGGFLSQSLRRAALAAAADARVAQDRISGLHRAVEHLAVSSESAEVARVLAEEGSAAVQADAAWVGIIDPATHSLQNVAAVGLPPRLRARFATVSLEDDYVVAEVAKTGEARFFADMTEFAAASQAGAAAYRDGGFRAAAVLPLLRRGEPMGVVAFHFRDLRVLSAEERELARAFAETAVQAFDRARLYEEILSTAELLQRSLLPFTLPAFPGFEIAVRYLPASDTLAVGGDWYDVVEAGQGQIGIGVGDVGGKGLEAAATMGRFRTAMRAYAIEHPAPSMVMRRLVAYHARTRPDAFATAVYASLDRRQRRLRIASLGHPPPLLVRDGRSVPLPVRPDPPLGIEAPRAFRELAVPVQTADLIVLLSDGVIERRDAPLDAGLASVAETAITYSEDDVDDLADRLISCVNDADAADDRALLVVRVAEGSTARETTAETGAAMRGERRDDSTGRAADASPVTSVV
jgi:serine phosphatase RsbU (regulator of sigma subunit)